VEHLSIDRAGMEFSHVTTDGVPALSEFETEGDCVHSERDCEWPSHGEPQVLKRSKEGARCHIHLGRG